MYLLKKIFLDRGNFEICKRGLKSLLPSTPIENHPAGNENDDDQVSKTAGSVFQFVQIERRFGLEMNMAFKAVANPGLSIMNYLLIARL